MMKVLQRCYRNVTFHFFAQKEEENMKDIKDLCIIFAEGIKP